MLRVLFAVLLCWPLGLAAQTDAPSLPAPLSDTISDYAALLPPDVAARVAQTLTDGRAETGVQVVLVTMERIADHGGAGARIEDYAKQLFDHWGVGDAARDDGILILVSRQDRDMRIALGAGYEVIWDNAAQRVIDRHFLPAFRRDDYPGGIEAGVAATFDLIAQPYAADNPPAATAQPIWDRILPLAVFGVIATVALTAIARSALADALVRLRPCPTCGKRHLTRRRDILTPASTTQAGHGLLHTHCRTCGWDKAERFTLPKRAGKSGPSGRFGGGSSSGGGASGRW